MTQHMMRYTVAPGQGAHNEQLLRALFDELNRLQPAGLRYVAFKLEDGVSFVHLIQRVADHEQEPVARLPALKAFHAGLRERCDRPPARTALTEIGAFGPGLRPTA